MSSVSGSSGLLDILKQLTHQCLEGLEVDRHHRRRWLALGRRREVVVAPVAVVLHHFSPQDGGQLTQSLQVLEVDDQRPDGVVEKDAETVQECSEKVAFVLGLEKSLEESVFIFADVQ